MANRINELQVNTDKKEKKHKDLKRKYINGKGNPVILEICWNEASTGTKDWSLWLRPYPEEIGSLQMIGQDDSRLSYKKRDRNEFAAVAGFRLWKTP